MFKHFLLTRFNLRFDDWESTKSGNLTLSENWLTERFHLFETYCLPSVINQTNQQFTWFIFFDAETPELFRDKIRQFQQQYSNFHPLFIKSGSEFRPSISNTIRENSSIQDKYILSSRIDNDDMIHKDFMGTIQRLFQSKNKHVIDLRAGYQLIIEKGKSEILKLNQPFNPFVSLVETRDSAQSVFARDHKDWSMETSVTAYDKRRLWMAVIHKNNLVNRRLRLKSVYTFNHADFALDKTKVPLQHPMRTLLSNSMVNMLTFLSFCKRKIRKALSS